MTADQLDEQFRKIRNTAKFKPELIKKLKESANQALVKLRGEGKK